MESIAQAGFTVIELLATLAILTGVTLTVFAFIVQTDASIDRSGEKLLAYTIAYDKYQSYETRNFSAITQGDSGNGYEVEDFTSALPADLKPPRSAKVFVRNITPTLKKLDVRLTYQESNERSRTINLSTAIQISGVGR